MFLPEGYDLALLTEALSGWQELAQHHKFRNNYDYCRSIYLLNGTPFLDGGFFLLKEDQALSSPVAVVYYEYYHQLSEVQGRIGSLADQLQCVISKITGWKGAIPPGYAQRPTLWDYADGVDTLRFLGEKI